MHMSVCCIGLGSMAFHGTLTYLGQQLDELPMVWFVLGCGWVVYSDSFVTPRSRHLAKTLLVSYASVFSVLHVYFKSTTSFQVHFGILTVLLLCSIYRKYTDVIVKLEPELMAVCHSSAAFLSAACVMWLIDYHGCPFFDEGIFNPYGHCWWHIFMGRAAYYSIVMLKMLDDTKRGKHFTISYDNFFRLPMAYRKLHPLEKGESIATQHTSFNRLRAQSDSIV